MEPLIVLVSFSGQRGSIHIFLDCVGRVGYLGTGGSANRKSKEFCRHTSTIQLKLGKRSCVTLNHLADPTILGV